MSDGEMSWNYRVLRHKDGDLEIVEMVYEGEKPLGWVDATLWASAQDGIESFRESLKWLAQSLDRPIIDDWRTDEQRAVDGEAIPPTEEPHRRSDANDSSSQPQSGSPTGGSK